MSNILSNAAITLMQAFYQQLGYLAGNAIVFALFDEESCQEERETLLKFANTVHSQEAREYLVQVVKQHRKLMTKSTKEELEKYWSHQDNCKVIIFSLFSSMQT